MSGGGSGAGSSRSDAGGQRPPRYPVPLQDRRSPASHPDSVRPENEPLREGVPGPGRNGNGIRIRAHSPTPAASSSRSATRAPSSPAQRAASVPSARGRAGPSMGSKLGPSAAPRPSVPAGNALTALLAPGCPRRPCTPLLRLVPPHRFSPPSPRCSPRTPLCSSPSLDPCTSLLSLYCSPPLPAPLLTLHPWLPPFVPCRPAEPIW
jgi:hypothetical protein